MKKVNVGFALCGSYCTFRTAIDALAAMRDSYEKITPIMSENAYSVDTRFGRAADFRAEVEAICGEKIVATIPGAEPFGPRALLDILVIAPCTGNTLAKIAGGITDSSVTMAAKAHLRNGRPLLIAVSTNDGLSANAANLGALLNRKNVYFVPFFQDDPEKKPTSLIADFDRLAEAIDAALAARQLQPVLAVKGAAK